MTLTEEFVNYGGKSILDSACYFRTEYLNGPLALKGLVSFLYNYSGESLRVEFYDKQFMKVPLCSVRLKDSNAVVTHGKSIDEFIMTHPWDIGGRIEQFLRGRLNTYCYMHLDGVD